MSTVSANATGLPDRRHFLSTIGAGALGLPALPAMAWAPGPVEPSASGLADATIGRLRAAKDALATALYAYEHALPAPHFTLDMTERRPWPFSGTVEKRLCDGKVPKRVTNYLGFRDVRYVATEDTIEQDLRLCEDRSQRRLLYRMRRRAKARAAKIAAMEASFDLDQLGRDVSGAEGRVDELMQALFAAPASTFTDVMIQAEALSAYSATVDEQYATFQAGRYGAQLAQGLQNVARAAA